MRICSHFYRQLTVITRGPNGLARSLMAGANRPLIVNVSEMWNKAEVWSKLCLIMAPSWTTASVCERETVFCFFAKIPQRKSFYPHSNCFWTAFGTKMNGRNAQTSLRILFFLFQISGYLNNLVRIFFRLDAQSVPCYIVLNCILPERIW